MMSVSKEFDPNKLPHKSKPELNELCYVGHDLIRSGMEWMGGGRRFIYRALLL